MSFPFLSDLDNFFCEEYANYDKLCVLDGYKMPVMQRTITKEDGRAYSYTLPASTMRLADQERMPRITDIWANWKARRKNKEADA